MCGAMKESMKTKIEITKNPTGYHIGSYGYAVSYGSKVWTDGGFEDRATARTAARKRAAEIKRQS